MPGFSDETVVIHLKKSYSNPQLVGNILVAIGVLVFVLVFPEAFEVIRYPALMVLVIAYGSFMAYMVTYALVRKGLKSGQEPLGLIRKEQVGLFVRSFMLMVFLPSFGEQYAHLLWFVAVLVAADVFSSTYISSKLKMLACLGPLFSFLCHYLYWNLPAVLAGESGLLPVKSIQWVEVGFMVLMIGLLFQARSSIGNNVRLTANITLDQSIVKDLVVRYGLSERESEILDKVLQGASTNEIAEALFISSGTVRNHLSHIFQKTETHSRMELAALVYAGAT